VVAEKVVGKKRPAAGKAEKVAAVKPTTKKAKNEKAPAVVKAPVKKASAKASVKKTPQKKTPAKVVAPVVEPDSPVEIQPDANQPVESVEAKDN